MKRKFETAAPSRAPESGRSQPEALNELSIAALRRGLQGGRFRALDVVDACLARISAREPAIRAWASVDAEGARAAASSLRAAKPLGGIPFGVKDVFRSAGSVTRLGSDIPPPPADRRDAAVVALLRAAGGIVLGKTATAEFAGTAPPETRHPHFSGHTPGGSSSGSAAAVADRMVPFALGTQTGGSVIRPAAFCGIVGFKPSYGLYPIDGMKMAAQSFDTVGVLARTVEDAAEVHAALLGGRPPAADGTIRIGIVTTHLDDTVQPAARDAFETAARQLAAAGCKIETRAAPDWLRDLTAHRAVINAFERYQALAPEAALDLAEFQPETRAQWEKGRGITVDTYLAARRAVDDARRKSGEMFSGLDILLTPATPGEAPEGLHSTGDPRLQELWTVLHMPTLCLPCGRGPTGLPLSLQLIAAPYEDERLLAAASFVEAVLGGLPPHGSKSGA